MSRSLVLCTSILLLSGLGCVAQEPNKGIQESIARLEEQVARLGEHLKSAQEGQAQHSQQQVHALSEREASLDKMRVDLEEQQRVLKAREAEHQRAMLEMKEAMARQRDELEAERRRAKQEIDQDLARSRQRAEAGELANLREVTDRRDSERAQALEMLAGERKQIAQLRAQVLAELDKTEHGAQAAERLRDENERLRARVSALERELARSMQERAAPPAPPMQAPAGSVVIHNEEGEIHLHFHGPMPSVSMPTVVPKHPSDATPGPAGPSGPTRARSRDAAPRQQAPAEAKDDGDDADGKRVNYARPAPKSNFVDVLLGSF